MTLYISDNADEFRIEISGWFASSAVADAAIAWKAALLANTPRRISIDITRMTEYDRDGYLMLREAHAHGTYIGAGTPVALRFLAEISGPLSVTAPLQQEPESSPAPASLTAPALGPRRKVITMPSRATASGE